jgi:hypothetical protein
MIITPHSRPFVYPIIQEYAALGLDPTEIELLCLFDTAGNLYDASGNERHGTINGMTFTGEGRYGIGGRFDGVNDYVDFGDILNFAPSTTPFSVSVWVNKITNTASVRTLIGKRATAGATAGWELRIQANEKVRLVFADDAANVIRRDTSSTLSLTEPSHIVATYDGSQNSTGINMYLNGVLDQDAGVGAVLGNLINNAINLQAGISDTTTNPLLGVEDNIMIYSDVLNASQIKNMCDKGL